MDSKTARIRALNDALRQTLTGGHAVITPGVAALGQAAVARIIKTIAVFDDFCNANDPYKEHDFGAFEAEGHTIFFKIEYFDKNLKSFSPKICRLLIANYGEQENDKPMFLYRADGTLTRLLGAYARASPAQEGRGARARSSRVRHGRIAAP